MNEEPQQYKTYQRPVVQQKAVILRAARWVRMDIGLEVHTLHYTIHRKYTMHRGYLVLIADPHEDRIDPTTEPHKCTIHQKLEERLKPAAMGVEMGTIADAMKPHSKLKNRPASLALYMILGQSGAGDTSDQVWNEGIAEELAEDLTDAWEADHDVVGMMAEVRPAASMQHCAGDTADASPMGRDVGPCSMTQLRWARSASAVILWLAGLESPTESDAVEDEVSMVAKRSESTVRLVPGPGRALLSRRPLAKGSVPWRQLDEEVSDTVEVEVEECSPAANPREEAAELTPYQVWQLLLGLTEESTLTVTSISQEGILPSYVYNNIIETLMDQDDEDFEAFEGDLGQILGDLTVTLRDIVETVRENRKRKRQRDTEAADAPDRTGSSRDHEGGDPGSEGDGAIEVTAFMQRTVTGVLRGPRHAETGQQSLHAELQQYEDPKAARLSKALLRRLQGQAHRVEDYDSVCAVLLAHADPEAETVCKSEEQEWVTTWERRLTRSTFAAGAGSSTDLPVMVDEETQPNQNDQDAELYEWHLAKTREDDQRGERNQVAAMAGWSVRPGPKRMRLEIEAGSKTEGGRSMTLAVAEGEEVRLAIKAVMEQGPDEYLHAGRPVEANEAMEAIRLEEERLEQWRPGDPTSGDQELMYQRRNKNGEERPTWPATADTQNGGAGQRTLAERLKPEQEEEEGEAAPVPRDSARQGELPGAAGDAGSALRALPEPREGTAPQEPERQQYQHNVTGEVLADPAQQDTEPYDTMDVEPRAPYAPEPQQTVADESDAEELFRISEEMEQFRALQRMGDEDLYRLWDQGKVTSQQLADAGGQALVNRLVQRKRRERKAGAPSHPTGDAVALGSGQQSEHLQWLRDQPRHHVDQMFMAGDISDAAVLELWGPGMLRELAQLCWDRRRAAEVAREADREQGGVRRRRSDRTDSGD
ncbi:unnamed protein product [Symbiodinium sp. CCMP2592]|nr:unnamed protein product [Symbiodinium sp. CCMP2592]